MFSQNNGTSCLSCENTTTLVEDIECENIWQQAYDTHKRDWKHKTTAPSDNKISFTNSTVIYNHLSHESIIESYSNTLQLSNRSTGTHSNYDIVTTIITEYTLNNEQRNAFQIITNHVLFNSRDQLQTYLAGKGSTGKSHIINALQEFLNRQNEGLWLRFALYTGVAAQNIGGMTLHAALGMSQWKQSTNYKNTQDLTALWEDIDYYVDYLFIDEVSMLGCSFMKDIHDSLVKVKGKTSLLGGINVIFSGDLAQLPLIGQTKLFS